MKPGLEKKLDRIFPLLWWLFCLAYFLPTLIKGELIPTSPLWYFERQLQFVPFKNFVVNCMIHAKLLPAWCPHFYGGFYYMAYPPNLIYFFPDYVFMFMDHGRGNLILSLSGFILAGFFFYRTLRMLGLSPYAGLFGILVFLGGSYFNLAVLYNPLSMFTYMIGLWATAGILRDQIKLRYLAVYWVCFGLGLGMDIEQEFYLSAAMFLFALFLARPPKWKRVLVMLVGFGFAFLFELGPVINLAAYSPHTVRSEGITFSNYISNYGEGGFNLKAFLSGALFPLSGSLMTKYAGLVTLLLAGIGVRKLRAWGWFGLLFIVLFYLYVLNWVPLMKLLFLVPVVNRMAMHYSAELVPALGLCFLAIIGADDFIKSKSRFNHYALLVVVLLLGIMILASGRPAFSLNCDWVRALGLFFAAALGGAALSSKLRKEWLVVCFLLAAVIFDVSYSSFRNQPRTRAKDLADRPAVTDYLSREMDLVRFWPLSIYLHTDTVVHPLVGMNLPLDLPGTHSLLGYWRMPVLRTAKLIDLIAPGYLMLDQNGLFNGLRLDIPRDVKVIDEQDLFWLRLFNVGNFISRGSQLKVPGIEPNGSSDDINFYRVSGVLPRYFLVTGLEKFKDPESVFQKIKDQGFDPKTTALVEQEFDFIPGSQNQGRVMLKGFLPGDWEFELNLPKTSADVSPSIAQYFLVVSECYMPGWRAFAAGKELRVFRANYGFMGLALKPGDYNIRLVFLPYPARIGLWCSLASICFWIAIGLVCVARKPGRDRTLPAPAR